jgi:hypothetical protein
MSIDLSEEDVSRLVIAIEHYEAYLRSQQRDDARFGGIGHGFRRRFGSNGNASAAHGSFGDSR